MNTRALCCAALLCVSLAVGPAGCGLKGPLTLPTRSDQVTIRGPGETSAQPAPAATPPAPAAPAPAAPAPAEQVPAAPTPAQPSSTPPATATPVEPAPRKQRYDRPPPPPLPSSNPGTTRG